MVSCSNQVLTWEIFGKESRECQVVSGKIFHLFFQSSMVHNAFNFANSFDWVEKLFKDQFHIFSIFKQQMGLISISGLLISNLSLFCFTIDHNVSMIECPNQKNEVNNDSLGGMNRVSY